MSIDWKAFYANGGYSNDNSDPDSYDDNCFGYREEDDEEDDEEDCCYENDVWD